jgi:cysteine-rich repeat protein
MRNSPLVAGAALVWLAACAPDVAGETTTGSSGDASSGDASTGGTSTGGESTGDPGTSTGDPDTGVPEGCGDGVRQDPEVCDDGNAADGDGCSADCSAASCLVPVTHPTIQAGVDDPGCPTLWVLPFPYAEQVDIARDVEVVGVDRPTLDGGGEHRLVDVAAGARVTLRGLTLTGGRAELGGAVRSSGVLALEDVEVSASAAEGAAPCGGGVWSDGELTLRRSVVERNHSALVGADGSARGGGVCVVGGALALLEGSAVRDNVAEAEGPGAVEVRGGGVFAVDAAVVVDGAAVSHNQARVRAAAPAAARGGGLDQSGGTLALGAAEVDGNEATVTEAGDPDAAYAAEGGGLALLGVVATASETRLANNLVRLAGQGALVGRGGGVHAGGGAAIVWTLGELTSNAVRVDEEGPGGATLGQGGGVYLEHTGDGAASTLALTDAWVFDNAIVGSDAGVGAGVCALALGGEARVSVTVERTTVEDNFRSGTPVRGGGFGLSAGPGARVELGVVNATVHDNRAERGGALAAFGAPGGEIAVTLRSATITGNSADEGAGLWLGVNGAAILVDLAHTALIANRVPPGDGPWSDCFPAAAGLVSGGHNALGALDCAVQGGDGDLAPADPRFEDPGEHGGPTRTVPLAANSPLRDAGDPLGCLDLAGAPLEVDQRGEPRPVGECDIGAYERQ